jgi:hypothetical protein
MRNASIGKTDTPYSGQNASIFFMLKLMSYTGRHVGLENAPRKPTGGVAQENQDTSAPWRTRTNILTYGKILIRFTYGKAPGAVRHA